MTTLLFDTLKFVDTLKSADFSVRQATAISEMFQEIYQDTKLVTKADIEASERATKVDIETSEKATKADIQALAISTRADINALAISTKTDIKESSLILKHQLKELEYRVYGELKLLKWMMGLMMTGILSLILKSFFM